MFEMNYYWIWIKSKNCEDERMFEGKSFLKNWIKRPVVTYNAYYSSYENRGLFHSTFRAN